MANRLRKADLIRRTATEERAWHRLSSSTLDYAQTNTHTSSVASRTAGRGACVCACQGLSAFRLTCASADTRAGLFALPISFGLRAVLIYETRRGHLLHLHLNCHPGLETWAGGVRVNGLILAETEAHRTGRDSFRTGSVGSEGDGVDVLAPGALIHNSPPWPTFIHILTPHGCTQWRSRPRRLCLTLNGRPCGGTFRELLLFIFRAMKTLRGERRARFCALFVDCFQSDALV